MIKALIFDFDGLIIDTETPDYEAWRETFAEHGAVLALEEWSDCIGREYGFIDPGALLEKRLGRGLDRPALKARRKQRLKAMIAEQAVCPGVVDYLDGARARGIRNAVASSAPRRWVAPKLEALGLAGKFECVKCEEDAERAKPAPDLFLAVLEEFAIAPAEAIALEDSPNGVAAAVSAGIFCVAVPNPVTRQLRIEGADLTVDSLAGLPLEELLKTASAAVRSPDRRCP